MGLLRELLIAESEKWDDFRASFSAVLNPCENKVTSAIMVESGDVIAKDLNSYFKLSGSLERPA